VVESTTLATVNILCLDQPLDIALNLELGQTVIQFVSVSTIEIVLLKFMHFVTGNCNAPPPSIDNGSVTVLFYNKSHIANYSCDENYVMEGDKLLVCNSKGSWSGITPKCGKLFS